MKKILIFTISILLLTSCWKKESIEKEITLNTSQTEYFNEIKKENLDENFQKNIKEWFQEGKINVSRFYPDAPKDIQKILKKFNQSIEKTKIGILILLRTIPQVDYLIIKIYESQKMNIIKLQKILFIYKKKKNFYLL